MSRRDLRRNGALGEILAALALLFSLVVAASGQPQVMSRDTVPPADALRVFVVNRSNLTNAAQWIGGTGGPQVWDFRNVPGDAENRYFYRSVDDGTPEKAAFPDAEIMERLSRDLAPANDAAYIRFLPGEGKETVGVSTQERGAQSDSLFATPLLEYPVVVNHGDKWDDDTTYPITLSVLTAFVEATVRIDQKAEVDGWGTVILPEIGAVEALRVNVASQHTTDAIVAEQIVPISDQHFRSYIWLAPGYGTIATLLSSPGTVEVPDSFTTTVSFERLTRATGFHTLPDQPTPMGNGTLTIRKMPGKSILSWAFPNAPPGATYSVEQSMTLGSAGNPWSELARTEELSLEVPFGVEENYFRVLQVE